jgi:hypothetical protein
MTAGAKKKMAGIVIEAWKLPIFERRLTQAGYTFANKGAMPGDALLLRVDTTNLEALAIVVQAANTEASQTGAPA